MRCPICGEQEEDNNLNCTNCMATFTYKKGRLHSVEKYMPPASVNQYESAGSFCPTCSAPIGKEQMECNFCGDTLLYDMDGNLIFSSHQDYIARHDNNEDDK